MNISRTLFGWSSPHIQPLTPVSEVSEPPESPSPYVDIGLDVGEQVSVFSLVRSCFLFALTWLIKPVYSNREVLGTQNFWFVFFGTGIFFTYTWISNYFSPGILMCNCAVADTTRLCPRTGGGKRSTAPTSGTICSPVCLCRCIWLAADDSGDYGSNCAWSCTPSVFVLFGENHQLICTLSTGLECRWPASSLFWFISKPGWWAFQGTFSSPVFHTPMILLAIYFVIQSFS